MGMTAKWLGRKTIKLADSIVNIAILTVIVLLLAFAGYALWDSEQILHVADKSVYAAYKPQAEDGGISFKELQALNPEVFAWLTVYGTNIDYPVTQTTNNSKYVNTNAEGLYSLSGAIFLDYKNSKDFSDFNSIIYGHHMEKNAMFGDIDEFADKDTFDTHRYGNLYFDGKDHGVEFFAFVHTDAYDSKVYTVNVQGDRRQEYLDDLLIKAINCRDIGVTIEDNIILLSTCSASSTNGRDILVGMVTPEVYGDTFVTTKANGEKAQLSVDRQGQGDFLEQIPWWVKVLLIILIIVIYNKAKRNKRYQKRGMTYEEDTKNAG